MGPIAALLLAQAAVAPPRLTTPEGWIEIESGDGTEEGGLSIVPALPVRPVRVVPQESAAEVPPEAPPRRRPCLKLQERVLGRLAYLHDLVPTDEPISPIVRAKLYPAGGRAFLANPLEPPIELSWDSELRDRFEAYNRCVIAVENGGR